MRTPMDWLRRLFRPANPPDDSGDAAPQVAAPLTFPPAARATWSSLDQDNRPGFPTLLVPALLERGCSVDDIAAITEVPRALIELRDDRSPKGVTTDPVLMLAVRLAAARLTRITEVGRRRRRRITVTILTLAALNLLAAMVSMVWHIPALGSAGTGGALLLTLVVFVMARRFRSKARSRPPGPGGSR